MTWLIIAVLLCWGAYERYRPRPIIARFVPSSDREDELVERCIDFADQNDALSEIAADAIAELDRSGKSLTGLAERLKRREVFAAALTEKPGKVEAGRAG